MSFAPFAASRAAVLVGLSVAITVLAIDGCRKDPEPSERTAADRAAPLSLPSASPARTGVAAGTEAGAAADAGRVVDVAAAADHSFVVTEKGDVLGWGSNAFGALGQPRELKSTASPTAVPGVAGALEVSSGTWHGCARTRNREILCWGRNFGGALGNGSVQNDTYAPAAPVLDLAHPVEVRAAGNRGCARLAEGTLRCWGVAISGTVARPERVELLDQVVGMTVAPEGACAWHLNGEASCWGVLSGTEFDYGDAVNGGDGHVKPVRRVAGLKDVRQMSMSATHTCAVTRDGQLFCWGKGAHGQLGTGGSGEDYRLLRPTQVKDLQGVTHVQAGNGFTCAVLSSGKLACFGNNGYGQLGLGDRKHRFRPETLGLQAVRSVALGEKHACAQLESRELYCWGDNAHGQLGVDSTGATDSRPAPQRVEL